MNGNGKTSGNGKNGNNEHVAVKTVQKSIEIILFSLAGLVDLKRTSFKVLVAFPINFFISSLKHKLNPRDKALLNKVLSESLSSTTMNTITGVTLLNLSEQAPDIPTRTIAQILASLAYRNADQILRNYALHGEARVKQVLCKAGPINLAGCAVMALISAIMKQMAIETGNDDYIKIYGNVINIAIGTTTRLLSMYSQTESFKYMIESSYVHTAEFSNKVAKYSEPFRGLF